MAIVEQAIGSSAPIADKLPDEQCRPRIVGYNSAGHPVVQVGWKQARLQLEGRTLHAPHLLRPEIASIAARKLRRGELHASKG